MIVAAASVTLHVHGSHSLKEKRHVVKTLTASLRQKFNVSVAEVAHQDLWQRAAIGIVGIAMGLFGFAEIVANLAQVELVDFHVLAAGHVDPAVRGHRGAVAAGAGIGEHRRGRRGGDDEEAAGGGVGHGKGSWKAAHRRPPWGVLFDGTLSSRPRARGALPSIPARASRKSAS